MITITDGQNAAIPFADFVKKSVDMEGLYGLYWETRKAAHTGRLPAALDHESWAEFCEDDPKGATEFITPILTFVERLLSFSERGDAYDLVPTGTWLPRQRVQVITAFTHKEIKPTGRVETVFSTERNVTG